MINNEQAEVLNNIRRSSHLNNPPCNVQVKFVENHSEVILARILELISVLSKCEIKFVGQSSEDETDFHNT